MDDEITFEEVKERAPKLCEGYEIAPTFEPALYYKWKDAKARRVDESGGGLGGYDLVFYRAPNTDYKSSISQGDLLYADSTLKSGGYDSWGDGQGESVVQKQKPAGLGVLKLPTLLYSSSLNAWLIHQSVTMPINKGTSVTLVDVFGDERLGYHAHLMGSWLSLDAAEEEAGLRVPMMNVLFGDQAHHCVRSDVLDALADSESYVSRVPLSECEAFVGCSAHVHLEDWQAGRVNPSLW